MRASANGAFELPIRASSSNRVDILESSVIPRTLVSLLLLALLACGGSDGASPSAVNQLPGPYSPSWAETPADPFAGGVPEAWRLWVEENHLPLASLDPASSRTDDFMALRPALAGKRIVQLGESSHGTAEFSAAKVRFIKFLHEEVGFDVIVFESSLFALHAKDKTVATEDPVQLMQNSIFGVWNTSQAAELFRYVKSTRSTARPLILAGMDTQVSTLTTDHGLQAFVDGILVGQDAARRADLREALDLSGEIVRLDRATAKPILLAEGSSLADRLAAAALWMDGILPTLKTTSLDPRDPLIARQAVWSRSRFILQLLNYARNQSGEAFAIRDEGMGLNLQFLANQVYPGRKLIVWAHNVHIQNNTQDPSVYTGYYSGYPSAGTVAKRLFGPELYTVGLFMYRGASSDSDNSGHPIAVRRGGRDSLEALLYCTRRKAALVPLNGDSTPGTEWMGKLIECFYWGAWLEMMVPRTQFDALLFVDTTTPATYLPRSSAQGERSSPAIFSPTASFGR